MNKEMTMNAQRAFPLTGRLKWLWLTCFLCPTVLFAVSSIVDSSFDQISGRWVYVAPLVSLVVCGTIAMFIRESISRKLLVLGLTIVAALLQFALDIIVFGWLALQRSGLEGVQ